MNVSFESKTDIQCELFDSVEEVELKKIYRDEFGAVKIDRKI